MNINNNQFEVKPVNSKRRLAAPCPNVFLNPALDLLANEDPICNTKMEVIPNKKRKRARSCEVITFENSGLDLGGSKAAVNEFLVRELDNVRKNIGIGGINAVGKGEKVNIVDLDIDNGVKVDKNDTKISQNKVSEEVTEILSNISNGNVLQTIVNKNSNSNKEIARINSNEKLVSLAGETNSISPPVLFPRSDLSKNCNVAVIDNSVNDIDPIYTNVAGLSECEKEAVLAVGNIAKVSHDSEQIKKTVSVLNSNNTVDKNIDDDVKIEPIYANLTEASNNFRSQIETITNKQMSIVPSINISEIDSGISELEQKYDGNDLNISAITNVQSTVTNQFFVNNSTNLSLSFIDRLALDTPNTSNQSLFLDDDLNESNIMEIKTITIITKKKRIEKKNTNPFMEPMVIDISNIADNTTNPFIDSKTEVHYNDEILNRPIEVNMPKNIVPRQLFTETNSTISTINESTLENYYENIHGRPESPVYENLDDIEPINKQSKILGHDVSKFSAVDILNLNKNSQGNSSHESSDSMKDFKNKLAKVSSKLSKKVFKTLKKTFHHEKVVNVNTTLNPYEVPRKLPKQKIAAKESGIENPALKLDNSDEIEIEEIEGEPEYETIKTIRNTRLNMNVTPLKERVVDNFDISNSRVMTPGKKVRFDSTLNQEKVITGDSFDYSVQSPGLDIKIDKYHDELENCINERKFLQQM